MSLQIRKPGAPIPSELVRRLRTGARLSQGEMAARLGLRGGRATVSAWESGKNRCEGPAAELILRLFGEDEAMFEVLPLVARANGIWGRTGQPLLPYRQMIWSPHGRHKIPLEHMSALLEATALSEGEVQHGFPFSVLQGRRYARATIDGWSGVLPPDATIAPKYLWLIDDAGRFLYREFCYEVQDPKRFPWGNIGIGFLLRLAVQAAFFLPRLYTWMKLPSDCRVSAQYELVGAEGKGFLFEPLTDWFVKVPPSGLSERDALVGAKSMTVGELEGNKVKCALSLVGALVANLDLAGSSESVLREHLEKLFERDQKDVPQYRELQFLHGELGK